MGVPKLIQIEEDRDEKQLQEYLPVQDFMDRMPSDACRRMILIDGPNVIHSAGRTGRNIMDIKVSSDKLLSTSILIIVQKLLALKFEVMIAMKKFFEDDSNSDNCFILKELKELELIRFLEDQIDDDEVVLRSAEFYGGAVVTRDRFGQSYYDHFKEGKSRSISYRYFKSKVPTEDFHKPEVLSDMFTELRFLKFERAFATPKDSDYEKVKRTYEQYQKSGYLERITPRVNLLSEYLQYEMCQASMTTRPTLSYYNTKLDCPLKFGEFKKHYLNYRKRNAYHLY